MTVKCEIKKSYDYKCKMCGKKIHGKPPIKYCDHCRALRRKQITKKGVAKYLQDDAKKHKHLVRMQTNRLLLSGKMIMQPLCAICGCGDGLECHHITYDHPLAAYAVVALCRDCHCALHAAENAEAKKEAEDEENKEGEGEQQ